MTRTALFATILTLTILSMGCRSKSRDMTPITPSNPVTPLTEARNAPSGSDADRLSGNYLRPHEVDENAAKGILHVVYFDFDRSDIRADQLADLEYNAEWLLSHPEQRVLIEGHCDERGTVEYNFALGERRANAVRDFLISRGVSPERLMFISKGEEEPAVMGTGEDVWVKNRRVEFKFAK